LLSFSLDDTEKHRNHCCVGKVYPKHGLLQSRNNYHHSSHSNVVWRCHCDTLRLHPFLLHGLLLVGFDSLWSVCQSGCPNGRIYSIHAHDCGSCHWKCYCSSFFTGCTCCITRGVGPSVRGLRRNVLSLEGMFPKNLVRTRCPHVNRYEPLWHDIECPGTYFSAYQHLRVQGCLVVLAAALNLAAMCMFKLHSMIRTSSPATLSNQLTRSWYVREIFRF